MYKRGIKIFRRAGFGFHENKFLIVIPNSNENRNADHAVNGNGMYLPFSIPILTFQRHPN